MTVLLELCLVTTEAKVASFYTEEPVSSRLKEAIGCSGPPLCSFWMSEVEVLGGEPVGEA